MELSSFNAKTMREFKIILQLANVEGLTVAELLVAVNKNIHKAYKPHATTRHQKKRCPECGGVLSPVSAEIKIIGCRKCRYSEVI